MYIFHQIYANFELSLFRIHRYSVGNLVMPQQISYLVSGMGPNLVAHNSGFPQWILTSRVAIESLGYGVPPIRFWVRIPQGWLGYKWIHLGVKFRRNRPLVWRNFLQKFKIFIFAWKRKNQNKVAHGLHLAVFFQKILIVPFLDDS